MKSVVRLNKQGFYNMRRDPAVVADLEARGRRIAEACNSGATNGARYEVGSRQGARNPQGRWRVTVITANAEAMADNARHHRLLRNADHGR